MFEDYDPTAAFAEEAIEQLDLLEPLLAQLREVDEPAPALIDHLFRVWHSLKGAVAMLPDQALGTFAHAAESLMALIRERDAIATPTEQRALCLARDRIVARLRSDDAPAQEFAPSMLGTDAAPPAGPNTAGTAPTPPASARVAPPAGSPHTEPQLPPGASRPASGGAPAPATETIRVSVPLLNELVSLMGELVLLRNRTHEQFRQRLHADRTLMHSDEHALVLHLDGLTSQLQAVVLRTRLQPLSRVFGRIPQVLRELAVSLNKQFDLRVSGEDLEVDRAISEQLANPLLHLIRNACDHGIETPDRRLALGKPAIGTLHVHAHRDAGHLVVSLSDDGAGVDTQRVLERARSRGLISPEQAHTLSAEDIHEFIFAPGFSTAQRVSQISGRGVGMDAARSALEAVGGSLQLASHAGVGSTMTMRLPLSLAVLSGVVIRCADQRVVLPQANVQELLSLDELRESNSVAVCEGRTFVRLRGALLPVVDGAEALALAPSDAGKRAASRAQAREGSRSHILAVLRTETYHYGLRVEDTLGIEELVLKPKHPLLRGLRTTSAACVLGDGSVAPVLDVVALAERARVPPVVDRLTPTRDATIGAAPTRLALHVHTEAHTPALLPLDQVARVAAVPRESVSRVADVRLTTIEQEQVQLLDYPQSPSHDHDVTGTRELNVVLTRVDDRLVGLPVARIHGTVSIPDTVAAPPVDAPELTGTAAVNGTWLPLLDLR